MPPTARIIVHEWYHGINLAIQQRTVPYIELDREIGLDPLASPRRLGQKLGLNKNQAKGLDKAIGVLQSHPGTFAHTFLTDGWAPERTFEHILAETMANRALNRNGKTS
jgi:hypothetical protein